MIQAMYRLPVSLILVAALPWLFACRTPKSEDSSQPKEIHDWNFVAANGMTAGPISRQGGGLTLIRCKYQADYRDFLKNFQGHAASEIDAALIESAGGDRPCFALLQRRVSTCYLGAEAVAWLKDAAKAEPIPQAYDPNRGIDALFDFTNDSGYFLEGDMLKIVNTVAQVFLANPELRCLD